MKALIAFLAAMLLMTGCAQVNTGENTAVNPETEPQKAVEKAEYRKITQEAAKEQMGQEGVIVLDVRTQEEYDEGHIEGALLLPVDQIKDQAVQVLPDKNSIILVYCRSGNRSRTASEALIEMGYLEVFDFGGIIDWPYETVK